MLLALAAGILWACAFPNPGVAGFAWIAPGLMLMTALGAKNPAAFRLGYIAGIVQYLASLHWLLFIPFPAGAVAGWLALSAYLALYPATWVALCWSSFPAELASPDRAGEQNAPFRRFVGVPLIQRACWTISCALLWVGLEMIMARLLTGFPWNLLGVSQYRVLPVIQIASVTGVYGVSFLVAWFSVALACAGLGIAARPAAARAWLSDLLVPSIALAAVCSHGVTQITRVQAPVATAKIALVQPSIPQTLIWDPKENTNRFAHLLRLTKQALGEKPKVLIWPEASVPNLLRFQPETFAAVRDLVIEHGVWMIVGADDAVPRSDSGVGDQADFYNSSFLISPTGEIVATYRKRRLVMFGEYVPLVRWFPFLRYLTPIGEGFKAGDRAEPFSLAGTGLKTSVLICFEDSFPHLARESALPDLDFLVNLTNNGWFGESAAQWQHAANAAFRAVENGLPLVRCANNGLSCWVDTRGGLHAVHFPESANIYQAGYKIIEVPVLADGATRELTFYSRRGDWFGWGCVGLTAGVLLASLSLRKRSILDPTRRRGSRSRRDPPKT